jgi:glycosyltransferase involved in cell wall biosynthesis
MSRKKTLVVADSESGAERLTRSRCARREERAIADEIKAKIRARIPEIQVSPAAPRRLRVLAGGVPGRPLRILMLGSLPPPIGGTTVLLQQLLGELRDRPDVKIEIVDTCDAVCARGMRKLAAAARVAWRALRRMRWAEVVVLHASTPATVAFGPILYAITRILRRPMILREFGGSLDAEYRGMSRLKRQLLRIAFRSDQVLLETHHLIEAFRHELPRANCQWYANSRPAPKRPTPPAHQPTGRFVFIGQVKPTKGIFDILEAVKISHPNIRVDVYGPLMDGLTDGSLPTEGRFRYRGVLEREAILPTLRRYDAVLLPTYHHGEGYPGIILEAFAAGRPVIASRWRSIPEIVEDGVSGILIPPHDPKALARAMASLVSSPLELQRMSEGARKSATRFSSTVWTDRLVRICRSYSRPRKAPSLTGLSYLETDTA